MTKVQFVNRAGFWLVVSLVIALICAAGAVRLRAAGRASVTVSASPGIILADGKSNTVITAVVRDGDGALAPNGTVVHFVTSLGTLDNESVACASGVARVSLSSAPSPGTASVTATSFPGLASGAATGTSKVDFTSNRDDVFTDGQARWMYFDSPKYLVYSADNKVIEADGPHGSAKFRFKSLHVQADSLQVNLQTSLLLAKNAVMERNGRTVHAAVLRYDLLTGMGSALVLGIPHHAVQAMAISGITLDLLPRESSASDASGLSPTLGAPAAEEPDPYRFEDISEAHVVVSARAISVDPGVQLQFRRASIYADGKKILSVQLHIMPVNGEELFGQQIAGFSSMGLFLNVPYYYNLSPGSTGALYIRNAAAASAGVMSATGMPITSATQNRSGFAIDLEQIYSLGRGGNGIFQIDGMTRGEWGAHWNHTQKIDPLTSGYLYIDYPSHRSLYASSRLARQFNGFSLNVTANASNDPGYGGYSTSSSVLSTYMQTQARQIGLTGISFVSDVSFQTGKRTSQAPGAAAITTPLSSRTLDLRFFTPTLRPNSRTQITDSFTVGQTWDNYQHRESLTMMGTLGLTRTLPGRANLMANYTYRYDPLYAFAGSQTTNTVQSVFGGNTQQHLALSYSAVPSEKLSYGLTALYGLPYQDIGVSASLAYRINNNWRFGLNTSLDHYRGLSYSNSDFYISRMLWGRDFVVSYSTLTKKFNYDFAGFNF